MKSWIVLYLYKQIQYNCRGYIPRIHLFCLFLSCASTFLHASYLLLFYFFRRLKTRLIGQKGRLLRHSKTTRLIPGKEMQDFVAQKALQIGGTKTNPDFNLGRELRLIKKYHIIYNYCRDSPRFQNDIPKELSLPKCYSKHVQILFIFPFWVYLFVNNWKVLHFDLNVAINQPFNYIINPWDNELPHLSVEMQYAPHIQSFYIQLGNGLLTPEPRFVLRRPSIHLVVALKYKPMNWPHKPTWIGP